MEMTALIKPLSSTLNEILSSIKEEFVHIVKNEILEYQIRELERILHNTKTFIERDSPVKFYDIYFPVRIEKVQSKFKKIFTSNISEIDSTNAIIQGNAGSGKSMLMKHLFIQAFDFKNVIPILIELRYVDEKEIIEYIEEILYSNKISQTKNITERIIESGKIHLFLDGFDEVPLENREKIIREINLFSKKNKDTKIYISSRPEVNLKSLPSFNLYKIQPLNDEEVLSFTKKQLSNADKNELDSIINSLKSDKKSFTDYTQNPLLLSMYIMTFKTFSDIPRSKSRFYYQVFETIYSKHDSVNKLSFRRPKVTNFKKEHFEELLNYFSYITLEKNKVTFSKKNLENDLERCKKLKKIPDFQITDLIEDLVVSINVIYKEGIYYSFPHKTLQEYFSACFIANLSFENKTNYYKKLSNDIAINPTQKSNYLSLLFEMDEINFSKYFLVPLFQEALKCLYGSFSRNYLEHSILIIEAIKNLGFKTSIKFGNNEKEFGRQISATITGLKHKIKTDILNEKKLI